MSESVLFMSYHNKIKESIISKLKFGFIVNTVFLQIFVTVKMELVIT